MAIYPDKAPNSIKDFLRYQSVNKGHTDKTVAEYFLDLRTFFRFMKRERAVVEPDVPFDDIDIMDIDIDFIAGITRTDINNYVDYLRGDRVIHGGTKGESVGLAAVSTQRKVACLKSFFSYYVEGRELLQRDPTIGIVVPKSAKSLPKYLSETDCFRLLDTIDGPNKARDYCIILLALSSGLRVSEIVSINLPDVNFSKDEFFLTITGKGNKERQVYLSEACVDAINDYLTIRQVLYKPTEKEKALFLSRKHNRISVDAVQGLVKRAMKNAGLKEFSPHKLRHTAATLMMQNGVDVRTVQEVLGHRSIATTQIYTHINADNLRDAAKANPMSRAKGRR